MSWAILGALVVGALGLGAAVFRITPDYERKTRPVLEESDEFILYSLSAWGDMEKQPLFHNFPILGRKELTDPALKARLVNTLYRDLRRGGPEYSCFTPSHGLRAVRGGRTIDVVICYSCGKVNFHENGVRDGYHSLGRDGQKVFEQAVREAKLPTIQEYLDHARRLDRQKGQPIGRR